MFGLLGIIKFIKKKQVKKKNQALWEEYEKVVKKEMETYCEKTASKYGITRGTNLLDLQNSIVSESYYYEEVAMKNEDIVDFLEKERMELIRRKDAMFDRIRKLPLEGRFADDKSGMRLGRNSGVTEEGGSNWLLLQAQEYIENSGIDFPVEEYLQKIHNWSTAVIEEIEKDIAILQKGISGEEYVKQQLKLYEGKYRILQNIVLESVDSQGNTAEVDLYIITDKGLVVAEVKNYGNEHQKLHITSDGRWVMENVQNGNLLRRIEHSPVEQNSRHCLAVERMLRQELGEECDIPIIPVIFIANNKVSIQNESRSEVIRVSEFYTFINSIHNSVKITKEMQEKIEKLLNSHNIGAQEFRVKSRKQLMSGLEKLEKTFTQYIMYNNEVAQEYQEVRKRNTPTELRTGGLISAVLSTRLSLIFAVPYLFIFLIEWTREFRIVLFGGYTIMLFNIPLGLLAGGYLYFKLLG